MLTRRWRVTRLAITIVIVGMALSTSSALAASPVNDNFSGAQLISGESVSFDGNLVAATVEAGEPNAIGFQPASVWYRWTAPKTAPVKIRSLQDLVIGRYTGSAVNSLSGGSALGGQDFVATGGITYYIRVAPFSSVPVGGFTATLSMAPNPPNDDFADAELLSGSSDAREGTLRLGTREPGELDHIPYPGETGSVWYRWVAPADGKFVFDICPELDDGPFSAVTVYTGNALGSLQTIKTGRCRAHFDAISGTEYRLAVEMPLNGTPRFRAEIQPADPPSNDDFSGAVALAGDFVTTAGTLRGAAIEASEPNHSNMNPTSSVWYSWTPATSGVAHISVSKAARSSQRLISVYGGSDLASLSPVAQRQTLARFMASQGTTYRVAVATTLASFDGDFELKAEIHPPPVNDAFATPVNLAGSPVTATGDTRGATIADGESDELGFPVGGSVWFSWTAPLSGNYLIDACDPRQVVQKTAAFTGTTLEDLVPVSAETCEMELAATGGTTYRILVDGSFIHSGQFVIRIRPRAPPANDSFLNAALLTGASAAVHGELGAGTTEPGEPFEVSTPGKYHSTVWYRWTAPSTGIATVNVGRPDLDVAVYRGNTLGSLVAANEGGAMPEGLSFITTAGTEYRIVVGRADRTAAGFGLKLDVNPETFIDSQQLDMGAGEVTFTFHGTPGDTANLRCSFNGSEATYCTSPVTYSGLADGTYTFEVQAEDADGNLAIPDQRTFVVDSVTPTISVLSGPTGTVNDSTVAFAFSSDDPETLKYCSLDGGPFGSCTSPAEITSLTEGSHSFAVKAIDFSGNASQPVTRSWVYSASSTSSSYAAAVLPGFGTSTDPADKGPTAGTPSTASVTLPSGGDARLTRQPVSTQPPLGYSILGQQFEIVAPDASAENPLILRFRIHSSLLSPDFQVDELEVMRDGAMVENCSGAPGAAAPDPCVAERRLAADGSALITVLSSHASTWNLALPVDDVVPPNPACEAAKTKLAAAKKTLAKSRAQVTAASKKVAKDKKALKKAQKSGMRAKVKKAKKVLVSAKSSLIRKKKASGKAKSAVTAATKAVQHAC